MALPRLPATVVSEYVGDYKTTISQRLLDLAKTNPRQVRTAAEQDARATAFHYCEHVDPPGFCRAITPTPKHGKPLRLTLDCAASSLLAL